ncbi:MAG TPA: hypothetical protein VFN68_13900 [Acidimicrobiales bacterium]|nr:hypothetical protein [Acidimicrobiales bacterium]
MSEDRLAGEGWPDRPGPETFVPLTWTPAPLGPPPARRGRRWLTAVAFTVVVAAGGGLGYLAWHNDRSAQSWRRLDLTQMARADQMISQVKSANGRIGTLNSQVATLHNQLSSLQGQLSNVATQKEKAVDQETVLQQLLSAAGSVADDLQQCLTATNQLDTDLNTAVGSGDVSRLNALEAEAAQVDATCNQAESANQQLQSAIQNAP